MRPGTRCISRPIRWASRSRCRGSSSIARWPIPGVRTVPIGFSWRKVALDATLALRVWALIAGRRFDVVHAVEESVFFALPARAPARDSRDLRSRFVDVRPARVRRSREEPGAPEAAPREWSARRCAARRLAITVSASLSDAVRAMEPSMARRADRGLPDRGGASRARPRARRERFARASASAARQAIVYTGNLESLSGNRAAARRLRARRERARSMRCWCSSAGRPRRSSPCARAPRRSGSVRPRGAHRPAPRGARCPSGWRWATVLVSPRLHGGNTPLKLFSYMWSARADRRDESADAHAGARCAATAVLCEPARRGDGERIVRGARRSGALRIARRRGARARGQRLFARGVSRASCSPPTTSIAPGVRSSVATSM